jgi:hypothetical protein
MRNSSDQIVGNLRAFQKLEGIFLVIKYYFHTLFKKILIYGISTNSTKYK